jgi:hypothetical protein
MHTSRSRISSAKLVALIGVGSALIVGTALGQGVQGPNTNTVTPNTLQPGGAAGVIAPQLTPSPGAGVKGELKGAGVIAPQLLPSSGGGFKAEPPPSPSKAAGANPAAMGNFENKNPAAMGNFESKQSGKASVPVGPRAAGYLKSPSKGDPKAKIGDIKGAKIIGEEGLVSPRDAALKSKANIKGGEVIGEDGLRSCATGKVC